MKKPHKNTFIFLTLLFIVNNIFSQHILHQPIIGAITENSAKILFFSDTLINYNLTISCQEGVMTIEQQTEDNIFFCNKLKLSQLMPNQSYNYTLKAKNDTEEFHGTFKTAPKKNSEETFSFVFGSCTEQSQDFGIFKAITKQEPNFFIHLGDWLYNKYNTTTDLSEQIELFHLRDKFIERYKLLGDFLKNTPIDYIFDDEDGIYDDFSKSSFTVIEANNKTTQVKEIPYPDSLKTILRKSLADFFPSYDEVNNQNNYHKFNYGNADFFVLDNRSTRTPNTEIFKTDKKGKLKYVNPNQHEILDSIQMNWLQDGLKNSDAKWKFIVSGVTFNKSYKKVFNICMRLQNRILPNGKNGAYIAASLSAMWFAYPNSQQKLIDFCKQNNIKNVIILSGDAHSSAIDDGQNAGFPEIMAGGLAQVNSHIASIIYNNFKLNLWNKGGQGIQNKNFNHAYGKVTVNQDSSVILEVIDDKDSTIAKHQIKTDYLPNTFKLKKQVRINKLFTFRKKIRIGFSEILGKNKF